MLKNILYYLLFITTGVRLVDIVYLLAKNDTSLPLPVFVAASVLVLYGIVMVIRKLTSMMRLKQMLTFYVIQTGIIVFNIAYVAIACPFKPSAVETLVVGTFLDLLINFIIIFACTRRIRGEYFTADATVKG